jgi:hypothetical protein
MPKLSRDSAPQRQEAGPVVDLRGELDGYTVSFTSVLEDIDATPLMKGVRGRRRLLLAARPRPGAARARHRVRVVQPQRRAAHGRGGHAEEHAGDAGQLNAVGEKAHGEPLRINGEHRRPAVRPGRARWVLVSKPAADRIVQPSRLERVGLVELKGVAQPLEVWRCPPDPAPGG